MFSFRRRHDVACETSPIRAHDEVIKRYSKTPIAAKIEPSPKSDTISGNDTNSRLTKLEMNLKRFEDERQIFAMEKEKFEREKWHMEQQRFQRLLEFERKRTMQQMEREQLAMQAAAIALAEIEKQRSGHHQRGPQNESLAQQPPARHRSTASRSRERSFSGGSNILYADDYESSTETTSSSRDGDFADFAAEVPFNSVDDEPINVDSDSNIRTPLIENNNNHVSTGRSVANGMEPPKIVLEQQPEQQQSLIARLFYGKTKPMATHPKRMSYLHIRVDDGGPISVWRIISIESPLVWHQVIELNQYEWEKTMRLRNRCIANFMLLAIFFGFGGLMFRFVEGAFENFYKCGVRRVKRDFVDHLWSSSQDLRWGINFWLCFNTALRAKKKQFKILSF